jgi:hypothetical protein
MSVITSADELRDDAKQHLEIALQRIYQSMEPNIWGSEKYFNDYYFEILKDLKKIIDKI